MKFTNIACVKKQVGLFSRCDQVLMQVLGQARGVVLDQLHGQVDKQIFMTRCEIRWEIRR